MRYLKSAFVACFVCFIAFVGLSTIAGRNDWSPTEGRTLNQFPGLAYSRLGDVAYLNKITNAFSDQISGRERKIALYNDMMVNVLGQKWVGSVAVGKEKQLYQEPEVITDEKAYEREVIRCAEIVNREAKKVAKSGARFIYINYPRKDVAVSEFLPDFYLDSRKDYEKYISIMKSHLSEDVTFIDAYDILKMPKGSNASEQRYYSNDHHVNFQGQMLIYQKLMSLVQEEFPDVRVCQLSDFSMEETVVNGSFNRRLGYAVSSREEVLQVQPKEPWNYVRKDRKTAIFGRGKDYARSFMGGDFANTVVVASKDGKKGNSALPKIFISGSSYTNSLEALCVGSFRSMHSVDYRSNKSGKTVADYVEKEKPDYVVYIPNQSDRHFSYEMFQLHLGLK